MDPVKKVILLRAYLIYFILLVFGLVVIGKIIYIQFIEGQALLEQAQEYELKYFTREAIRGNIYSSDGNLMATSVPIFDLRMDVDSENISNAYFNDHIDGLAQGLSHIFGNKTVRQYKTCLIKAREKHKRYYLIKRNITYNQLKEVKKLPILNLGPFKGGLIAVQKTKRQMPFGHLARRTIGFEAPSDSVYVGLEGAYTEVLAGQDGKQLMRRINHGDWIPVHNENEIEPMNGHDIISTIDIGIQDVAQNALREHLQEQGAHHGNVVLMEVQTGKIRAIANLKYDSVKKDYFEVYNYAIGERYEPGSTFKLASLMVLLEDQQINLNDTIDIGDGWTVYFGQTLKDVHKIGDGKITIREAFEKSSNVGISKLIFQYYKDRPEQFIDHLYKLGLNQSLGIEIKGESIPLIKHPDERQSWYGTSLPWMSIGYELMFSPLQLLTFYNAVANEGTVVKPMFIEEIRCSGHVVSTYKPVTLHKSICSKHTLDTLQSLLEGVVARGTAQSLNNSVYKIAGKTGTAQIADGAKGYDKVNYNSSFIGYFPADIPKYSCIVNVSRPTKGKYYGSSVAAPVFKEIADKIYATHLDIPMKPISENQTKKYPLYQAGLTQELKSVIKALNLPADTLNVESEWAVLLPDDDRLKLASRFIHLDQVPNVTGMNAEDAVFILEKLGLHTIIKGRGVVRKQSLDPGQKLIKGKTIKLELTTT